MEGERRKWGKNERKEEEINGERMKGKRRKLMGARMLGKRMKWGKNERKEEEEVMGKE